VFMTASAGPAAWLAARIDLRVMMAVGLVLYVISFWMMSYLGPDWGFSELFLPQAIRGVAVLFSMVPVVGMALRDMPDDELKDASGFNNLMRNLGGAVGIAAVNTWLIEFSRVHAASLLQSVGKGSDSATTLMTDLAIRFGQNGLDLSSVRGAAAQTLVQGVRVQALALAFDDVFRLTAWIFAGCLILVPFCRGGPMSQRARGHHH